MQSGLAAYVKLQGKGRPNITQASFGLQKFSNRAPSVWLVSYPLYEWVTPTLDLIIAVSELKLRTA